MHLTSDEEKLLNSGNETVRKCMEIIVAIGEIYGADRLVKIKSAQISGISYRNIGDAGLEWLESLDARVAVKSYTNPAGMDLERWREMGIGEQFYSKQMRIVKALQKIGVEVSLTCAPYYLRTPAFGDHLAWAESSAVVYANSVIGARTNRESGISALASAIIGKTPCYGLHLKENRAPEIFAKIDGKLNPAIAGYELGKITGSKTPLVDFGRELSHEELKLFGAALAASGGAGIFHAINLTPEWDDFEAPGEKVEIDSIDIESECDPDLIAIGCPHVSARELREILNLLKKHGKLRKELWIFTSRKILKENIGIVREIEKHGARVFADTCMVVSPATEKFECVMVNSGKAFEYLPKLRGVDAIFGDIQECIRRASE